MNQLDVADDRTSRPGAWCLRLRRSEAALTMMHIQQRDGRWCIVDLASLD